MHHHKAGKHYYQPIIAKGIIFLAIAIFASSASAEYYFVYPNSSCNMIENSCQQHRHHKYKKVKIAHYKSHKKQVTRNAHHSAKQYACAYQRNCCYQHTYHKEHSMRGNREYYDDRANYSQDLSTADDNTFFYPGMNIDR